MKSDSAKYIDAFVFVVPKKKVEEYRKMAKMGKKMWMKHGALSYRECMGDDLNPDMQGMEALLFPKLLNLKPSETAWFSYIEYKSKAHRNQVNKKVMKDMEHEMEKHKEMKMPFDMKRFSFGGFKISV